MEKTVQGVPEKSPFGLGDYIVIDGVRFKLVWITPKHKTITLKWWPLTEAEIEAQISKEASDGDKKESTENSADSVVPTV